MPSSSGKQHRLMELAAHNPQAAKRVGVPQSVAKDFVEADKGKTFTSKPQSDRASRRYGKKG